MKYEVLRSEAEVAALIEWHGLNSDYIIIDTETTSVDPLTAKLVDVQISGRSDDEAFLFSGEFAPLLLKLSHRVTLVACYAKYDQHVLYRHGVDLLDRTWRCTVLDGHLANETRPSYSLQSYVTEIYGGTRKNDFWDKYESYLDAPEAERVEYACADIVETNAVYKYILADLQSQGIPEELRESVNRLSIALLYTEMEGIAVDLPYLTEIGVKMKSAMESLEPQIRGMISTEMDLIELRRWISDLSKRSTDKGKSNVQRTTFSFNNPHHLKALLYDCLELPEQYKWVEGRKTITADADALGRIKNLHPVIPVLIKWREYPTIYNTFIQGTLEKMRDGRIYPSFKINGTKGARISHENPNMGNIPAEGGVKGIWIPDDGWEFSEHDYGQLEVCIEAHLTQDKNLLSIVCDGASKHDITAHSLGIPRSTAKTINFAMQYHCTAKKVAKILGVSESEGENAWRKFWETYPGPMQLKQYTDKCVNDGIPLVDMFGQRRRFPVKKRNEYDGDYRSGYNFVIQSPGARMLNNAYYKTDELFRREKVGKGVLTVHDSQLISTLKQHTQTWASEAVRLMVEEGVLARLTVPLKVSSNIGMPRWSDK